MNRRHFLAGTVASAAALLAVPGHAHASRLALFLFDGRDPRARRESRRHAAAIDCAEDAAHAWRASVAPLLADRPVIAGLTTAADFAILADFARRAGLALQALPDPDASLIRWHVAGSLQGIAA